MESSSNTSSSNEKKIYQDSDWSMRSILEGSFSGPPEDLLKVVEVMKRFILKPVMYTTPEGLEHWLKSQHVEETDKEKLETTFGIPIIFDERVPQGRVYIMERLGMESINAL